MATELIGAAKQAAPSATTTSPAPVQQAAIQQQEPFSEITDYFSTPGMPPAAPMEVPMTSIEMALPEGILSSLPDLDAPARMPSAPSAASAPTAAERRVTDGLVKEVTVPLNLSLEELRQHRRMRLKITLDVNLLP